jgi:alpha-D-xyloside xylohydrolase
MQSRDVYLPAGTDWYNYWTNEKHAGGQTIRVAAPIDTIPLFVRAGSVIPFGAPIQNTSTAQALSEVRVYPGKDAEFLLYDDDGVSYDYEKGIGKSTRLHWDQKAKALSATGDKATAASIKNLVKVIE